MRRQHLRRRGHWGGGVRGERGDGGEEGEVIRYGGFPAAGWTLEISDLTMGDTEAAEDCVERKGTGWDAGSGVDDFGRSRLSGGRCVGRSGLRRVRVGGGSILVRTLVVSVGSMIREGGLTLQGCECLIFVVGSSIPVGRC